MEASSAEVPRVVVGSTKRHYRKRSAIDPSIVGTPKRKCQYCEKMYANGASLHIHVKKLHGKAFLPGVATTKLYCAEADCEVVVEQTARAVREHLVKQHGRDIHLVEKQFKSENDFRDWKAYFEKKTVSCFINKGNANVADGKVAYYYCNRSGSYTSNAKVRQSKDSCKSGGACTAFMKVRINKDTGRVVVTFCPYHYNHEKQLRFSRLPDSLKVDIARKLKARMSINDILSENQKNVERDSRASLLTRKDIRNIAHSFGLTIRSKERSPNTLQEAVRSILRDDDDDDVAGVSAGAEKEESDSPDRILEIGSLLDSVQDRVATVAATNPSSDCLKQCARMLRDVDAFLKMETSGPTAPESKRRGPQKKNGTARLFPGAQSEGFGQPNRLARSKKELIEQLVGQMKDVSEGDHNYCIEPILNPSPVACPVQRMIPPYGLVPAAGPAMLRTSQIQVPAESKVVWVPFPVQFSQTNLCTERAPLLSAKPRQLYPASAAQLQIQLPAPTQQLLAPAIGSIHRISTNYGASIPLSSQRGRRGRLSH